MRENDLSEGERVTVNYSPEASRTDHGRRELTTEVRELMGDVAILENPYDDYPLLVLDGENYLWARSESGEDGLFGSLARLE